MEHAVYNLRKRPKHLDAAYYCRYFLPGILGSLESARGALDPVSTFHARGLFEIRQWRDEITKLHGKRTRACVCSAA